MRAHKLVEDIRAGRMLRTDYTESHIAPNLLQAEADKIALCQKFEFNDVGGLYEKYSFLKEGLTYLTDNNLLRCPFPVVWLEHTWPGSWMSYGVLVQEASFEKPADAFSSRVFIWNSELRIWADSQMVLATAKDDMNAFKAFSAYGHLDFKSLSLENKEWVHGMTETACGFVYSALGLLMMGADQELIAPPEKINAKRVKRGKLPLFGYSKVTVDMGGRAPKGDHQGGTHASPRKHWRRGHIRRLGSSKEIFIQPMIVGSHGFVDHEYRVK